MKPERLFSAERPIEKLADDQLSRSGFAIAMARTIAAWRDRESLVLAIYGPWGSGKSSLRNMILDALAQDKAKTIHLEFNPWEWSGQDKVLEGFFGELSAKLGASDQSKAAGKTALVMRMYGAMFSVAALITGALRPLIAGLFLVLGIVGIVPLFVTNTFFLRVLAVLGFASVIVSFLTWSSQLTDRLAAYLTAKSEVGKKSVADVKKELGILLKTLQNNLLVVIDDIDRLTPEGVRMVFQLVKVNADFSNVVYLLLFQREVVEKALSQGELDGAQFLDKVIQVGFDIPKLSAETLEETLQSAIGSVLEQSPANQQFDTSRWTTLFLSAIRPYFRTLRDVKRITNTLNFLFEMYKFGDTFDVNPIDLIALEVLRQFEPSVYHRLHEASTLVTGYRTFDAPKGEKKDVDALFTNARRSDYAREIVAELFPEVTRLLAESDSVIDPATSGVLLADLRVCHPDMFERYFKFSLGEEDLSEAEIASVLELAGRDRYELVSKLKDLHQRHLLPALLTRLRVDKPLIPPSRIDRFITALFDIEKELAAQPPKPGKANVSVEQRALFIIRSLLRRASERGTILHNAIKNTTGLYLPLLTFGAPKEQSERLVSEQVEEDLREESIRKIRDAALSGQLLSHFKLKDILYYWSTRGPVDEAPNWVASQLGSDTSLIALLRAFTESAGEMTGSHVVEFRYKFAIEAFARYADPASLEKRVLHLANSPNLNTNDVMVCRLFLRALPEWRQGKKEPGGPPDYSEWSTIADLSKDHTPEAM